VILRDGALIAWAGRTESNLLTFLPGEEPERSAAARDLARALAELVNTGRRRAVLVGRVDGADPRDSPLAPYLAEAGFFAGSRGYLKRALPKGPPDSSRPVPRA
jgi:ATP-dependent Lhr-like helicase